MVPILVICLLKMRSWLIVPPSVAQMPEHRLADSRLVDIVATAMSVVTAIGAVSLGSSLNEMNRALAGVVPTKQAPMSAIGTNRCFVLMDCLLGGCGCLNRISASISGASAGVMPPRGKAAS